MRPDIIIDVEEYYHIKDNLFLFKCGYKDSLFDLELYELGLDGFEYKADVVNGLKRLTVKSLEKAKKEALKVILEIKEEDKIEHQAYKNFMFNKELNGVLVDE